MTVAGYCIVCQTDIDVELCCDGHMCPCQGQPVDPPVCSKECYDTLCKDSALMICATKKKYYLNIPKNLMEPEP